MWVQGNAIVAYLAVPLGAPLPSVLLPGLEEEEVPVETFVLEKIPSSVMPVGVPVVLPVVPGGFEVPGVGLPPPEGVGEGLLGGGAASPELGGKSRCRVSESALESMAALGRAPRSSTFVIILSN